MGLYTVFPVVLNMSITAGIAIVVVLLARVILKRAPKIFSYALWAVVLFRLLCPISLSSWFSLMSLFQAPTTEAGRIEYVSLYVPDVQRPEITVEGPVSDGNQTADRHVKPPTVEKTAADSIDLLGRAAGMVWICGVAAMLVFHIVQFIRLCCQLTGSIHLKDNIYLADYIPTPFVMGLIHPKIYLPSAVPDAQQSYIIQHEKHHIRRWDHVIKLLAFLALCIHWFNPLVWIAFVLSNRDMEMSCDEAVMKQIGGDIRADYSSSLLQFSTGKRVISGTPLTFGEGDTRERIENIMRYRRPTILIVALAVVVCVGLTACLFSNPQSAPEKIDLATMDKHTLQNTLLPYLDAYHLCVSDSYGAEVTNDRYWRCYRTEAASQSSYENDPTAIEALIPSGTKIPDGLYVDAAYADCLPVSNYASIGAIKSYFGEWIAEDAEFLTTGLATFFFEYEGRVYRVAGAHGSGSMRIDPQSATLIEHAGDDYLVQVDRYLFDEKEPTPVTLTFTTQDGTLMLVGDGDNTAEYAPPSETQLPARPAVEMVDQADGAPTVRISSVEGEEVEKSLYWHHIEDETGIYLEISPETTIYSFQFVSVEVEETASGLQYLVGEERYAIGALAPEKPFLVKLQFAGLLPTYGIVFEDHNHHKKFYTINMKGTDPGESYPYYLQEIEGLN